jgi:glycosyltransferase involved in cell wall biosynthesis
VTPEADILSIGTLEPRKNQIFLLKVLAHAKRLGHIYTLTMIGRGPSLNELQEHAIQLGIETQVQFPGRIDGAARLLPRHRVYAHAAIVENLPITLVEALAAGRPIFAPAVGGIPEVFADGREGVYWDLEDEEAAAEKLIAVLEDSALYQKLSRAAHERYEEAFSPTVLVPQWLHAILAKQGGNESSIAPAAGMSEIQLG